MVEEGASIIDVGGESTRPGAEGVDAKEELSRVRPVVAELCEEGVRVSIDTSKPEVAEAALNLGAEIVNDVTACRSEGMAELVSAAHCGVVLMHMQGEPRTMHLDPAYEDVVNEVEEFLLRRLELVLSAGVEEENVVIDPGIGFGKNLSHNLELIRALPRLSQHRPIVLGTSRKSFLGTLTGTESPADRDVATAVTTAVGYLYGARVFRVHDVSSSGQALAIGAAMVAG